MEKKKTTESVSSKKYEIKVSTYYYDGNLVSIVGIQDGKSEIYHEFKKKDFKSQDLFEIARLISNESKFEKKDIIISMILSDQHDSFVFPVNSVKKFKSFGKFIHKIESAKVEIL